MLNAQFEEVSLTFLEQVDHVPLLSATAGVCHGSVGRDAETGAMCTRYGAGPSICTWRNCEILVPSSPLHTNQTESMQASP